MDFLIEFDELLEKHYNIWDKVGGDIKKELVVNLSLIKNF